MHEPQCCGSVCKSNCGHPPPLRLTADGGLQALNPRAYATPLGLHPDLQPSTFTVSPGDRLVFYTDGLLEARDRAGRYFRLEDCADTLRQPDLQAAADGLLDQLLAHTRRKLDDDVALLLVEATSPVSAGLAGEPGQVTAGPVQILAAGQAPGPADDRVVLMADPESGRALAAVDAELMGARQAGRA